MKFSCPQDQNWVTHDEGALFSLILLIPGTS